jgi:hypothetical protein
MDSKTLLTADEFELMPDDDSFRTELDEGEVITIPFSGVNTVLAWPTSGCCWAIM